MRTVVHISDLHFGHEDPRTVAPLIELIRSLKPHVVAVSGDLTQRARRSQFRAARAFLDALPNPQVVVPGNHDVPLFDVARRFLSPFHRYRRFITDDVSPFFADGEIALLGVNTARSFTWKSGRVKEAQLDEARRRLDPLPEAIVKILVLHHPFDVPPGAPESDVVRGARKAMAVFAEAGADVFLSGHLHVSHVGQTAQRYRIEGHSALIINAGTATSTRHRGETNTFNVLEVSEGALTLDRYVWAPGKLVFERGSRERFTRREDGWKVV